MHIFYAYTFACFRSRRVSHITAKDNAYLEAALLVASGYKIAEVKECMMKLPRTNWAKVWWYEGDVYVDGDLEDYFDVEGRRYRIH